jgi:small subunit ribosomal protein S17
VTAKPLRSQRKIRTGVVVGTAMDKTVVVVIERLMKHAHYKKYVKRVKRLLVHDEESRCGVGDRVQIMETRPISKRKHWRLVEIVEKAK